MMWNTMDNAPKDKNIVVWCPAVRGLSELYSECRWHPDAGFTVHELLEPKLWTLAPVKDEFT